MNDTPDVDSAATASPAQPLFHRRALIVGGATLAVGASLAACGGDGPVSIGADGQSDAAWAEFRRLFPLSAGTVHMSAMLITSHPAPVSAAIERHRRALDADPVVYLESNNNRLTEQARSAAGQYFGVNANQVALTDSATMGIGLVYNAIRLSPGQEILSTEQDYFVTHEAIRLAAERTGATTRHVPLYDDIAAVDAGQMVERIRAAISPRTRVLALTWVHSSTGLKIPARAIADAVAEINRARDQDDRVLFCLDAVHGVGNQDDDFDDLGCDFLMTSCHKWLFGPRGTGVVVATRDAWASCIPIIPSFIDDGTLDAWVTGDEPGGPTTAARMTPGGFKSFEHQWALAETFALHRDIGRGRIKARTDELALQLKEGLNGLPRVELRTPQSADLSAGIVSFDVDGLSPRAVVRRLRDAKVIASVAPYATPHVRLTPSIHNTTAEVEAALEAISAI